MTHLINTINGQGNWITTPDASTLNKLITSGIVLIVIFSLRLMAIRFVNHYVHEARPLYQWRKGIGYGCSIMALCIVGGLWLPAIQGFSTFLGITTAGVAVALKDPLVNLIGWFFILWRHPFQVGDRIQIGHYAGDVIDIRIFQFTLMEIGNWVAADQSTGRVVHVPNGKVFQEALANYSRGFQYLWNEMPVLITFESNWEQAKDILLTIAAQKSEYLSKVAEARVQEAAQTYMIFYSKLTPAVYTSVRESGILLTIRYLCEPRQRRGSEQEIWEAILTEFASHPDIQFAYPTQRLQINSVPPFPDASHPNLRTVHPD